jgi:hypothetical protein
MAADEREHGTPGDHPGSAWSPVATASRMYRALAALDEAVPRTRGACRAAAFRYLESVQREGVGPGTALCRLRAAAARWVPARLGAAERLRLHERLHFWVGTIYRLRWAAASDHGHRPAGGAA